MSIREFTNGYLCDPQPGNPIIEATRSLCDCVTLLCHVVYLHTCVTPCRDELGHIAENEFVRLKMNLLSKHTLTTNLENYLQRVISKQYFRKSNMDYSYEYTFLSCCRIR